MAVSRAFAATVLAGSLLVPSLGYAEVGRFPNTPITSAYIYEINTDWVKISVNADAVQLENYPKCTHSFIDCLFRRKEESERRMHNSGDLLNLAEFDCKFYNRTAVLLSQSTDNNGWYFFFACAIP